MKQAWLALASAFALTAAAAHAQEDAGVGDEEGATVAPAPSTPEMAPVKPHPKAPLPPFKPHKSPPFDPVKDARYRGLIGFGVMLEVGGVAALITSSVLAINAAFPGDIGECGDDSGDPETGACEEDLAAEAKRNRTAAWVLMPVGVVAVIVGAPMIAAAAYGHRRQKRFKRLQEAQPHLAGLSVTLQMDGAAAGGLTLSGSF